MKHFMRKPFEKTIWPSDRWYAVCNIPFIAFLHVQFENIESTIEHTRTNRAISYQLTIQLNIEHNIDIGNFLHARKCSAFDRI